jgi:hypothetical protein
VTFARNTIGTALKELLHALPDLRRPLLSPSETSTCATRKGLTGTQFNKGYQLWTGLYGVAYSFPIWVAVFRHEAADPESRCSLCMRAEYTYCDWSIDKVSD